ncbi:endonuclease/exonuclease/phosphatase family protein [Paenibacillus sp.]|uniref:endonuclease/exonuclease/phosphatase family protein n=1 Tax=Paenibacillus sp. TaxID=58172 RepID=UPI002810C3B6|nr:endonuclease/exonuclease/phosphatase family protein [Paenibacillus sp.]
MTIEFNVMSFNLRYNNAGDGANAWPRRVEKVVRTIRRYDPLLIGTQEGLIDMLTDLDERLPEFGRLGMGRLGGAEGEFNAIFYKKSELVVVDFGQFWLSDAPEVPASVGWDADLPRICTRGRFRHRATGRELYFFNTHLDHRGREARIRGSRLVGRRIDEARAEAELPLILTGDFNCHPSHEPVRYLRGEAEERMATRLADAYGALPDGRAGLTAHDFRGGAEGEPIDYIFVTEECDVKSVEVVRDVVGGGYPSDHYPIVASLRIR